MNGTCESTRLELGAYALGTLPRLDVEAVEMHLRSCARCRDELTALHDVVASLASVTLDDLDGPQPIDPPSGLFERIAATADLESEAGAEVPVLEIHPVVGRAVRRSRRGRRRSLLIAAAAVLVVAGVGVGVAVADRDGSADPASASATRGGITLAVSATGEGPGSRLALTVAGLPRHQQCRLVATADDGSVHDAGRWTAGYDGQAEVIETTEIPPDRLHTLTLYGPGGRQLVAVDL